MRAVAFDHDSDGDGGEGKPERSIRRVCVGWLTPAVVGVRAERVDSSFNTLRPNSKTQVITLWDPRNLVLHYRD